MQTITCYFVDICLDEWNPSTKTLRLQITITVLENCCCHCCWLADLKFQKCSCQKCLVGSVTANLLLCPSMSSLVFCYISGVFGSDSFRRISVKSHILLVCVSAVTWFNINFHDAVLNGLNLWMINSIWNQPFC